MDEGGGRKKDSKVRSEEAELAAPAAEAARRGLGWTASASAGRLRTSFPDGAVSASACRFCAPSAAAAADALVAGERSAGSTRRPPFRHRSTCWFMAALEIRPSDRPQTGQTTSTASGAGASPVPADAGPSTGFKYCRPEPRHDRTTR